MNKILEQTLLFDFYGELLTEKQRRIYTQVVLEDYSLSEVAEEAGISRQGVHDMIKRVNHILSGYEEKLQLVHKFVHIREKVNAIHELTERYGADDIAAISNEILEEL